MRSVADPLTGALLVASHDLTDGHFRRAVVLILAHDPDDGAAGVILNRPGSADLPARLAPWRTVLAAPEVMFIGGPVGRDTVIAVATGSAEDPAPGWQPITEGIGVVDLTRDVSEVSSHISSLRLFSGYAGWGGGQMEREIASGAWFVVPGRPDDAIAPSPDALWRTVLARQGGLFTTVPEDPSLN